MIINSEYIFKYPIRSFSLVISSPNSAVVLTKFFKVILREVVSIEDTPFSEQLNIFINVFKLSCIVFNFSSPDSINSKGFSQLQHNTYIVR